MLDLGLENLMPETREVDEARIRVAGTDWVFSPNPCDVRTRGESTKRTRGRAGVRPGASGGSIVFSFFGGADGGVAPAGLGELVVQVNKVLGLAPPGCTMSPLRGYAGRSTRRLGLVLRRCGGARCRGGSGLGGPRSSGSLVGL